MEAPMAPARKPLRFEGSAGEYFKIWIVNVGLTIVTLGIFSAWAKVRNRRYFLGNTFIDDHSFDYHGAPLRILLGRVIALVLLGGYSISVHLGGPRMLGAWGLVFLVALPWLVRSSLRFNARNTSYRNIRFDFHGTYGGAFWAFVVWMVFVVLSLGTLVPLAHRARDYYIINNHRYGGKNFAAVIPGGRLYLIYLAAIGIFFAGIVLMGCVVAGLGGIQILAGLKPHAGQPLPPAIIPLLMVMFLVYFVTLIFVSSFLQTMSFNLALNHTRLGSDYAMEATLSPIAVTWIIASNVIVTLLTLGLMYPWAHVRQTRYTVDHLAISGPSDLDGFVSAAGSQQGAIGEEVAGFFDIDFGL